MELILNYLKKKKWQWKRLKIKWDLHFLMVNEEYKNISDPVQQVIVKVSNLIQVLLWLEIKS